MSVRLTGVLPPLAIGCAFLAVWEITIRGFAWPGGRLITCGPSTSIRRRAKAYWAGRSRNPYPLLLRARG